MFKKPLFLLLAGLLVYPLTSYSQEEPPKKEETADAPGPARFWQATLGDGHFMVALDRIVSVSRHQYVLDGTLIVDEVTVDTVGQALARFYHIVPVTDATAGNVVSELADRGRELIDKAAERAGTDLPNMVVKKYPETTHAKSVEYRLLAETDLNALYTSVRNAWESGRGRQFTVK